MLPYSLIDSLAMFFIYSFIGWVVEVVYYGITEGQFINRGFLYGPLCPVYGLGFYAAVWFFEPLKTNFAAIFFGGAFACTLVELIVGIILYQAFHLRWWDYSSYKYNFKGYICLRFYLYWGIACSFGMYMLHPAVLFLIANTPKIVVIVFISICIAILLLDLITSVTTIIGFSKKLKAFNSVASRIKIVSDKVGGGIYDVVDTVVANGQPVVDHYSEYRKMVSEHRAEEEKLAKEHRAVERKFMNEFFAAEVEQARESNKAVRSKMLSIVSSFKWSDKRLLRVLRIEGVQNPDENSRAMSDILKHYFLTTKDNTPDKMVVEEHFEEDGII